MTANHPPTSIESLLAEREWVRNLAASLVADPNRADDVAQDAWLAAVTRPPEDGSSPRGWLGAVVRNWAKRSYRGDARRRLREMAAARPESMPSAAEMVARAEAHRHVVDAVIALAEPYRSTVLARFFEDMPPREIARRMEVPVETVRTRLKRGLAQLRERLDAKYGGDGRSWGIALGPLAVKGGLLVKATTKAAIAVAAVLIVAAAVGVAVWSGDDAARPTTSPADGIADRSAAVPAVANGDAAKTDAAAPVVPAGRASVRGEVWFASPQEPAAGVTVAIGPVGAAKVVRTDDAGRFRLDGLPAGFRGSVRARGETTCEATRSVMRLRDGDELDVGVLWLAAPATADVLVRAFDGAPVEGAEVEAWRTPAKTYGDPMADGAKWRGAPEPAARARTDAVGRARLTGLEPGILTFTARRSGFAPGASRATALGAGLVTGPIRIDLERGTPLAGRVIDGDGRGVAGIVVWAEMQPTSWGVVQELLPHVTSGADGAFAFEGLVGGTYALRVQREPLPPVSAATVRVPTSARIDLVVANRRVVGVVREAGTGAPIAGASVRALNCVGEAWNVFEAITGADGRYALDTVVPADIVGSFRVTKPGFMEVQDPNRANSSGVVFSVWLPAHGDATLDFTMRRAARLAGRVTAAGEPVRGAAVVAHRNGGYAEQTTTGSDGRYVFEGIDRGPALVRVSADGVTQEGASPDDYAAFSSGQKPPGYVLVPEAGEATFDVEMEPGLVVEGRVVGADGMPVAGSTIRAGSIAETACGADGTFRVTDTWGRDRLIVIAWHPDLGSGRFEAPRPASGPITGVEIKLTPYARVSGRVTAAGGDLRGAWVQWARQPEPWPGQPDREPDWTGAARTPVAADGTFDVAAPFVTGDVVVRAGAPDLATAKAKAAKTSDVLYTAEIRLEPAARLAGRVVVAATGAPCAGATVVVDAPENAGWSHRDGGPPTYLAVSAVTDGDGKFVVEALAAGEHRVRAQIEGLRAAVAKVTLPSATDLVLSLERGETISGTAAFSDGAPVVGGFIRFRAPGEDGKLEWLSSATTDENGRFTASYLPAGTYELMVDPEGWERTFKRVTVKDVRTGTTGVRITVERIPVGLSLKGRVVGADGTPIAGADVGAGVPSGERAGGHARSESDGSFEITGLEDAEYVVTAFPPRPSYFVDAGVSEGAKWLYGELQSVRPPRDDVVVTLRLGEVIDGVVVDASGAPQRDVWVLAKPLPEHEKQTFESWLGAKTDVAGRFEIAGLDPGRYRLVDSGFRGRREPAPLIGGEDVATGSHGLRLTVGTFATLGGTVVDDAGRPVEGAKVRAYGPRKIELNTKTDAAGAFGFAQLDPGAQFDVVAWAPAFAPSTQKAAVAGSAGLRIVLAPGRKVSGRLLGADGKPLAKTRIVFRTNDSPVEPDTYTDAEGRFAVAGLLAVRYRASFVALVDHLFREFSCGMLEADASEVELRAE